MAEIGMLGAGSWGTALSWLLDNNGHHVTMWSSLEDEVELLKKNREHTDKLPGVKLSDRMDSGPCGSFALHKEHCKTDEGLCKPRTDHRKRGEGNRRKYAAYAFGCYKG